MDQASVILGIDPGTRHLGYAFLSCQNKALRLIEMDTLKIPSYLDTYQKLQKIYTKIIYLIQTYQPQTFAIEAPFFGKNVQSMLKLGRAQGVAIAAAIQSGLDVTEYSPKTVKQAVTGNGNADKEQVWKMLQQMLQIPAKPAFFDATDALAVAVCHYYQTANAIQQNTTLSTKTTKYNSWTDYVQQQEKKGKKT